jgi:hypothetical protein
LEVSFYPSLEITKDTNWWPHRHLNSVLPHKNHERHCSAGVHIIELQKEVLVVFYLVNVYRPIFRPALLSMW